MKKFLPLALLLILVELPVFSQNAALSLGGTNAYVTFGNNSSLGLSQFTLECWFRRNGTGSTASTGTGGVTAVPLIAKGRGEQDGSTLDCNYFLGIRSGNNVLTADFEEGSAGSRPGQLNLIWHNAYIISGALFLNLKANNIKRLGV